MTRRVHSALQGRIWRPRYSGRCPPGLLLMDGVKHLITLPPPPCIRSLPPFCTRQTLKFNMLMIFPPFAFQLSRSFGDNRSGIQSLLQSAMADQTGGTSNNPRMAWASAHGLISIALVKSTVARSSWRLCINHANTVGIKTLG